MVAALQVVEYDRTFASAKFFFNKIKGNAIISGAFGLFRKNVVIDAGWYSSDAIGEDMELVMKLSAFCIEHGIPYKIDYIPSAICWTQAPENLRDLRSQRNRWHIGMRQNINKYRRMILNPRYGSLGSFTLPIFILFELLSPTIEVLGIISVIAGLSVGAISIMPVLILTSAYGLFGIFSSLVAFSAGVQSFDMKLKIGDAVKVIGCCLYEYFFMHWYLLIVRFIASYRSTKKRVIWKSITRKKID